MAFVTTRYGRTFVGTPTAADYNAATSAADVGALNQHYLGANAKNVYLDKNVTGGIVAKGNYTLTDLDRAYAAASYKFQPGAGTQAGSNGVVGSLLKDDLQPMLKPAAYAVGSALLATGAGTALAGAAGAGGAGAGAAAEGSAAGAAGSGASDLVAEHMLVTGAAGGLPETAGLSAAGTAAAGTGTVATGSLLADATAPGADAATQQLIAEHAITTGAAGGIPETAGLSAAAPAAAGAAAIPEAANNLGTAQAVDPIAAPTSEALPPAPDVGSSPGSAGIGNGGGAGGGTSPSTSLLTQASDMIGHINTFAQGALAIGGLLGGLAGLQGGKTPGSPESPPPLPMGTQVGSQADVKAGLQAQGLPGGPLAGNASTWLTGASGVDPDKLNIGRSTLLGQ